MHTNMEYTYQNTTLTLKILPINSMYHEIHVYMGKELIGAGAYSKGYDIGEAVRRIISAALM